MRWVIGAVVGLTWATSALAGDYDVLRGPEPTYHWGGVYGGVQGGYSSAVDNFSLAASPQIAYILRETTIEKDEQISRWPVLGSDTPSSTSVGGFIGYNVEWENLILGLELNYNHVSLSGSSQGSLSRSFYDSNTLPTGHNYDYTVNVGCTAATVNCPGPVQSSLKITDIATFRARAGWQAGNFLPYGFFGFAVGRADFSTSTNVSYMAVDVPVPQVPPLTPLCNIYFPGLASNTCYSGSTGPAATQANAQNGAYVYGFATGLGLDVALTSHVFVRGEFEYIYFAPLDSIQVSVISARVAAGIKF